MFTVRDIELRFNVTTHTVLGWIAAGELKAINVGRAIGKKKPRWRISQSALDGFEAARATTPLPRSTLRRRKQKDVIQFYS